MLRRLRRFLLVASPVGLTVIALVVAALGVISNGNLSPTPTNNLSPLFLWLAVAVAAIFWMAHTRSEYIRRTNDPTWALRLQDEWNNIGEKRKKAAEVLLDMKDRLTDVVSHKVELEPIDDVLDVLEDIAFYVEGDQISPEVAHHHFFHWVRGYWFAGRQYIEAWRIREPARWDHVGTLYEELAVIESNKERKSKETLALDGVHINEFLQEERQLDNG